MTQQRVLIWSERRCITALLTWGLVAMTHGQCDFSTLHGQQFFDGYTPSGGVILRQYNDLTDTIIITVDGTVREIMNCVQHGSEYNSFTSYVFTKQVSNKTVYLCVQQFKTNQGLYFWQTPTNSSIDVATCFTEFRNKPKNTLFSIKYPFTLLDRRICNAPVGLFHAVLDSTTSCADDVSSFVQINSTWMYTKTCLAGDNSYEYPQQANFSCYQRLFSVYFGVQDFKYSTLVSIIINERRAFYCLKIEIINGQRAIQLLPQSETLNCNRDPSLTILLLADQCDLGVCQNGGTCLQTPDTYTCQCTDGFIGHDCSIVDGCLSDPCMNGATCTSDVDGYSCHCRPGYEGMLCETDINECASLPCMNRATCVDGEGGFRCRCQPGFDGVYCQIDVYKQNDKCSHRPCLNDGVCVDIVNGYACACDGTGYSGDTCDDEIDECASNPCESDQQCVDLVNSYVCRRQPDITEIDECASNPCESDQQCVDMVNSFVCQRQPDITAADPCASIPCNTNARCVTVNNSFSCLCPPGFSGVHCSNENDHMSFTVLVVILSLVLVVCLLLIIIGVCVRKSISAARGVDNTGASTEGYENMVRQPDESASDAYTMISVGDSDVNRDSSLSRSRRNRDYAEPTP